VTFRPSGDHHGLDLITVRGELMQFDGDTRQPTMESLEALQGDIAGWEEYYEEDLEELIVRLQEPAPDAGAPKETIILEVDQVTEVTPARGGEFVDLVTDYYLNGVNVPDPEAAEDEDPWYPWTFGYDEDTDENLIEDVDGIQRPYEAEEYDKIRWTFAPPVLWNEGHKVQPEWFYSFLHDPVGLREQLRVRMPSFHFERGEAEAVADYFAYKTRQEWPSRWARTMRLVLGRDVRSDAVGPQADGWNDGQHLSWPIAALMTSPGPGLPLDQVAEGAGLSRETLAGIEAGSEADISSGFEKLFAWGTSQGFSMTGPASTLVRQRTPGSSSSRHLPSSRSSLFTTRW